MKMKKKTFNIVLASTASFVIVVTAASAIGGSYAAYMNYYNQVQSEKEHQKYLDSLPLEFLGITAKLKDGVKYFSNGRANPQPEDFLVKAQFTEKGKESEAIVQSKDINISVPDNFKTNGGKVEVSYTYTYEKDNKSDSTSDGSTSEETPKKITKTAEVDISLTAVKIDHLVMEEKPYRVYYSNDMKFSLDGIKLKAIYNDESEKDVKLSSVSIKNGDALKEGQSSVQFVYSEGSDEATFDVPVTVVKKSDYNDGKLISIDQEGEVTLNEGEKLTSAKLNVRGTYENGNRLIINESEYEVEGNVTNASFMKNCILTIKMKNSSLFTKVPVKVFNALDPSKLTFESGTKKTVDAYINSSKDSVKLDVIEGAKNISFNLDVSYICKTKFTIRLANLAEKDISLGKNISLLVNNHNIALNNEDLIPSTNGAYVLKDIQLPDLVLKEGNNLIKFVINEKEKIVIAKIEVYNVFEGKIYTSLDDYMGVVAKNNDIFDADLSQVVKWSDSKTKNYCHGLATDGQFIYGTTTTWSTEKRKISVVKIDPKTSKIVATSGETTANYYETNTGITYYDGKLVLFHVDGGQSYIDVKDFKEGVKFIDCKEGEEILKFEGLEGKTIRDVYYNASNEKFAVLIDKTITIFGKDMKKIASFTPKITGNYGSIARMSGTSKYILVNYSRDGNNKPTIAVYDYDGNRVGQYQIPNSLDDMGGSEELPNPSGMNTQGIVYLNGVFYFSLLRFTQKTLGDTFSIMSAKLKVVKENIVSNYTFGEYVDACSDTYKPKENVSPIMGALGNIDPNGYQMGLASDGKYIYAAKNINANAQTQIIKINPTTWEVEGRSGTFDTLIPKNESGNYITDDNSQLMIKDNKLYAFIYPNEDNCRVVSISLDDFEGKVPEADALPFEGKTTSRIRSGYYSHATSKYAVVDTSKSLYFFDDDGNQIGEKKNLKNYDGMNVASITGDEKYIYVSYYATNQSALPVEVYTLSGDYVAQVPVKGIVLGEQSFNIQSIMAFNGNLYAGVCSWNGATNGTYLWKVSTDSSVFPTSKLNRIEVTCDTKRFSIGDDIRKHLKVVAHYDDGSKEVVTDYTLDKSSFQSTSETSFRVSYKRGNITKTFEVTGITVIDALMLGDLYLSNPSMSMNFTTQSIDSTVKQYAMGGVFHNGFIYLASSVGGDHTPTTISKIDPSNGYTVVATKTFSNAKYSGDGSQLFVKGNDLYYVNGTENGSEFYKIDLEKDFMDPSKEFTKVTLPINNAIGIQYSETNKQYVALVNGTLKTYDETGKEIKTFNQKPSVSGFNQSSIFIDDSYIYVSFKVNSQKEVPIMIYRWDGTYVGKLSINIPTGLADSNYNIQSVFINGNKLYATVCTWGGIGRILFEADFTK